MIKNLVQANYFKLKLKKNFCARPEPSLNPKMKKSLCLKSLSSLAPKFIPVRAESLPELRISHGSELFLVTLCNVLKIKPVLAV